MFTDFTIGFPTASPTLPLRLFLELDCALRLGLLSWLSARCGSPAVLRIELSVDRRPLSPSLSNSPVETFGPGGDFRSDAALFPNYFGQTYFSAFTISRSIIDNLSSC